MPYPSALSCSISTVGEERRAGNTIRVSYELNFVNDGEHQRIPPSRWNMLSLEDDAFEAALFAGLLARVDLDFHSADFPHNFMKALVVSNSLLRTDFHERAAPLDGQLFALLGGHLPLIVEVALVADQNPETMEGWWVRAESR